MNKVKPKVNHKTKAKPKGKSINIIKEKSDVKIKFNRIVKSGFADFDEPLLINLTLSKLNFDLSVTETISCFNIYFKTEVFCVFENNLVIKIQNINNKEKPFLVFSKILFCLNRLAFAKDAYLLNPYILNNELSKVNKQNKHDDFSNYSFKIEKPLIYNEKNKENKNDEGHKNKENDKYKDDLLFGDARQIVINTASLVKASGFAVKVNLKNPDYIFKHVSLNGNFFLGLLLWQNLDKFESRRTHLRETPHPTSINPRLARAMINLSEAKKQVLDPFCGTGGILLEALLINLKAKGVDFDVNMISRAKINLKDYKDIYLYHMDALDWNKRIECVVSDVPYGKSSKLNKELFVLISSFLNKYSLFTNKIVLCMPSNFPLDSLLVKPFKRNWIKIYEFNIYIHKSLTRKIVVLKNVKNK